MKNLEEAQREMRERNARKRWEGNLQPEIPASEDSPEVLRLKREISVLTGQVTGLQNENNRLRQQKTIVVEPPREHRRSGGDSGREQQHNFLKYSNARRY
jgi:hypothetical protein